MNKNHLTRLLKQADSSAEMVPLDADQLAFLVRRRLQRRKQMVRYVMPAAAAILVGIGLLGGQLYQLRQKQQHIVRLEKQVQQLAEQTEATLAKMQQLLDSQEAHLQTVARYDDPAHKIETAVEEAAFLLIYQAERMAEKYNRPDAAANYYRQVIEYFGDTSSAEIAKERLNKVELQPHHI